MLLRRMLLALLALTVACGTEASHSGEDVAGIDAFDSAQPDAPTASDAESETDTAQPLVVTVAHAGTTVTVDRTTGRFDIALGDFTFVRGATSAVETGKPAFRDADTEMHPATASVPEGRTLEVEEDDDGGVTLTLVHPPDERGTLRTVLRIRPEGGGVEAWAELESGGLEDLVALIPVYVDTQGGDTGLIFPSDVADLLVLQNGSDQGADHYVELLPGDTPFRQGLFGTFTSNQPSAASNWNAVVFDRAAEVALLLGFLSFDRVVPEVVLGFEAERAPDDGLRRGFPILRTRSGFLIARSEPAGSVVRSERVWLARFDDPEGLRTAGHAALETYARELHAGCPEREAPPPMAEWDSWYVYGDAIDEEIIRTNLAGLAEHFGDYGLTNLQVDLGWDMEWGSWRRTPPGFPSGMDALAAEIEAAGLSPTIWMAAFDAMGASEVVTEHPDWAGETDPLLALLAQPGAKPLDISRPEVVAYVRDMGVRLADWGYDAVKFDFAYYTLFLSALSDPSQTVASAYRQALAAFREGLGDERVLVNILLMGTNCCLVDGMRIGIDTWACWGDDPDEECPEAGLTTGYGGMGLRIALKTLARRYYLNEVWANHPDQIFFRDHLGLVPQRSWGTAVALSGGVISLGEEVATMTPDEIDTFRRFLPNWGALGVPLDLFDRTYPETWVTRDDESWVGPVVALYNWGTNADLSTNPPIPMAEEAREHRIRLSELGIATAVHAFEFWTESDLGVVEPGDTLTVTVPPRDSRVLALHPVTEHPYVVSSNRHVSGGAVDLTEPTWDAGTTTLSWQQDLVADFAHTVWLAPAGHTGTPAVTASGDATATVRRDGELWAIDLAASRTGTTTVTAGW